MTANRSTTASPLTSRGRTESSLATGGPSSLAIHKTSLTNTQFSAIKGSAGCRIEPEGSFTLNNIIDFNEEVMCCKFAPSGSIIAVGLNSGLIKIINIDSGQAAGSLTDHEVTSKHLPVTALRFIPSKKKGGATKTLAAGYSSGFIKIWHYANGQCLQTLYEDQQILCIDFNSDLSLLASAGSGCYINIYSTATMNLINTCRGGTRPDIMDGHRMRIFALQFHPEEVNQFISGGWDGTIQFWDSREVHSLRKISGVHICGEGIDIDSQNKNILSASWRSRNGLQLWDYKTGDKLKDFPSDTNASLYYCAQFIGRNLIVAGGCEQHMLRLLSRLEGNTIGRLVNLPTGVKCVDHFRTNKVKIIFGAGSLIYFVEVNNPV